jgi:hypothetical protein
MTNATITYTAVLAAIAACIHFGCLITTYGASTQNHNDRRAVYEVYTPAFVSNSTLTTTVQRQLVQSCPRASLTLLTMRAEFDVNATKYSVNGAWIATQAAMFGFVHLNGYHLLYVIFTVSCAAQLNVLWEYYLAKHNDKYDFFEEPCAARWLEYAITSPAMITVIASCLAIRDANTILLLAAAQGALVQFGFAMECAFLLRVDEEQEENDDAVVAFRPFPIVPVPRTRPRFSQLLWYWSFVPSTLLHVLVWGILISSFQGQTNTRCFDGQPETPPWLVGILLAQCVLFAFFMLLAVWQAFVLDMVPFRTKVPVKLDTVKYTFRVAFLGYTILSALAKAVLGITYLTYVTQFPFYTPV